MADDSRPDGSVLSIAGLVTGLQFKTTKQGKPWALATIEDLEGAIEVLFFPQTFEQVRNLLRQDLICVVRGRLNRRDEVPTLYAMELTIPDVSRGVRADRSSSRCRRPGSPRRWPSSSRACWPTTRASPRCTCGWSSPAMRTVLRLDDGLRVTPSPALFGDLKHLLGPGSLVS